MNSKKCKKCGTDNPRFFTHCINCMAPLMDEPRKVGKTFTYLKIGLILCVSILLIIYVFIPAVQSSKMVAQNFSEIISSTSAIEESRSLPQYPLNHMVKNNDLQITIISAADDYKMMNSKKSFLVKVFLENVRTSGNIRISSNNFELIDSKGTQYYGYLDEQLFTYDLSPSQNFTAKLKFIIPQEAIAKKIRVTFPGNSNFVDNIKIVEFVI
jgi:hypothetical protein